MQYSYLVQYKKVGKKLTDLWGKQPPAFFASFQTFYWYKISQI